MQLRVYSSDESTFGQQNGADALMQNQETEVLQKVDKNNAYD